MASQDMGVRVKLGDRVLWLRDGSKSNEAGIVKWIGVIENEQIAGIEFDRPLGLGSGFFKNQQLFVCRPQYGGLVALVGLILEKDLDLGPTPASASTHSKDKTAPPPPGHLLDRYADLLRTGQYSDVIIAVKEASGAWTEIKVHKAILAAGSPVFQKILESRTMRDARKGSVIIEDFSPTCVRALLQWIYTGRLTEAWKGVGEQLVAAGDKYKVHGLLDWLDKNLHVALTLRNAMKLRSAAKAFELNLAARRINAFIVTNINKIEC